MHLLPKTLTSTMTVFSSVRCLENNIASYIIVEQVVGGKSFISSCSTV